MSLELSVDADGGLVVALGVGSARLRSTRPAAVEVWSGDASEPVAAARRYDRVEPVERGFRASATFRVDEALAIRVEDTWTAHAPGAWDLHRTVAAGGSAGGRGVRSVLALRTTAADGRGFPDLSYFAPPALWDKNDLDEDGVEDYLGTQTVVIREDRLNARSFMALDPAEGWAVTLVRLDAPRLEPPLSRPRRERRFFHATDIGSIGVRPLADERQVELVAYVPFAEVDRSHALLVGERPGWEAFWPLESGTRIDVAYRLRAEPQTRLIDAGWSSYVRAMGDLAPEPVALPTPVERLVGYRLQAERDYYREGAVPDGGTVPAAGFVANAHPQDGRQLANLIQFGFTGQSVLNAYNLLRDGHATGAAEDLRMGRAAADFFAVGARMPQTGMFRNSYNLDTERFDCWWMGLLLPLAYARPGEALDDLMGPLYEHLKDVVDPLARIEGSYLRCMSEDSLSLLMSYQLEREHGAEHPAWLDACRGYGEFLVRVQNDDGSWFRAYDVAGAALLDPPRWFGSTFYEQRSSSATPIRFLVRLFEELGDQRYLDAACRAGRFVRERIVAPVRFSGGVHDSMYAKGQLIDYSGIMFPMWGLLDLYRITQDPYFLDGAVDAGRLFSAWTCLWDVPLPEGSTLERWGFRTTGILACDTAGAGYVHAAGVWAVAEMAEIARLSRDPAMLDVAELTFLASQQTVSTPERSWGYASPGIQEEGYLVSWLLIDDPIFADTSFGDRLKGEGNKTLLGWIAAAGAYGYSRMLDLHGTVDFDELRRRWGLASSLRRPGAPAGSA